MSTLWSVLGGACLPAAVGGLPSTETSTVTEGGPRKRSVQHRRSNDNIIVPPVVFVWTAECRIISVIEQLKS